MSDQSRGYIKCCFPCYGGPVGTLDRFSIVIPADKRDDVKAGQQSFRTHLLQIHNQS